MSESEAMAGGFGIDRDRGDGSAVGESSRSRDGMAVEVGEMGWSRATWEGEGSSMHGDSG